MLEGGGKVTLFGDLGLFTPTVLRMPDNRLSFNGVLGVASVSLGFASAAGFDFGVTRALVGSFSCLASSASFLVTTAFAAVVPVSAFLLVAILQFRTWHNDHKEGEGNVQQFEEARNLPCCCCQLHFTVCATMSFKRYSNRVNPLGW